MAQSISNVAVEGIHRGFERASQAADRISKGSEDLAGDLIELGKAKLEVAANAKVVQVDHKITDSILDIIA